jgi:hypothetical protein
MHMALPMREYFAQVHATDVFRYGPAHGIFDFLDLCTPGPFPAVDWIFINPPFNAGTRFVQRARMLARRGVAVIARSAFAEGGERHNDLFRPEIRPAYEITFCERVVMLKGRLIRAGAPDPFNLDKSGQPQPRHQRHRLQRLRLAPGRARHPQALDRPGTRRRLERDADYPDYARLLPETEDHCCDFLR